MTEPRGKKELHLELGNQSEWLGWVWLGFRSSAAKRGACFSTSDLQLGSAWVGEPAVAMMEDDVAGAVENGTGLDKLKKWVAEGLLFCPADAGRRV
ncbi:hypothetical protein FHETE_8056 [Fusarium heterosporum]|uniref:Uncharacterized protein n=1 Tax=Fusarium heterosporum TaxID=42747 RepID=A0A8H5T3F8_FUSHE|nr:hypothetical protein FHETE_8056 [Fusarium heterosporum]